MENFYKNLYNPRARQAHRSKARLENMAELLDFTAQFTDLVPSRPLEHFGDSDLTFGGRIFPALKIHEDGGESGCGGKLWIAGELLCEYLLENSDDNGILSKQMNLLGRDKPFVNILELGSGTGLVGLCAGSLARANGGNAKVHITDIDQLVRLMEGNVELNGLASVVSAEKLWWGEPLKYEFGPDAISNKTDLVLAADCVYLETAFPLLEKTLLDLTEGETPPVVLMSYRKRRKADRIFFKAIRKNFKVVPITSFDRCDDFLKQRTHLFQLIRVQK